MDNSKVRQREVEKYIKFFTLKSLQCVIESRVGTKNKTKCNPSSKGLDWFNVSVPEGNSNRRLNQEIHEHFGKKIVPGFHESISLDIVIKTAEGRYTVLESWQIFNTINDNTKEKKLKYKNQFSVYNRFSVLLKSVIVISKVLPSYHLSRGGNSDFLLFFKVHKELYNLHNYEMHNKINIGSVETILGNTNITVLYKNKIWLNGTQQSTTMTNILAAYDFDNLIRIERQKTKPISSTTFQSLEIVENEIALAVFDAESCVSDWFSSNQSVVQTKSNSPSPTNTNISRDTHQPVAAFAESSSQDFPILDLPALSDVLPFQSLLDEPQVNTETTTNNNKVQFQAKVNNDKTVNSAQRAEAVGFEDDFVLVELRPAFCSDADSVGKLYQRCQKPPPLALFLSLDSCDDSDIGQFNLDHVLETYRCDLNSFRDFFK